MSTITLEELLAQLKEMIKDIPPIELGPKSAYPYHPHAVPHADIIYNSPRGVVPDRELIVNVLKQRKPTNNSELRYDWDALREKSMKSNTGVLLNGNTPDICGKCGKPWLDHEFAVPAPYCP